MNPDRTSAQSSNAKALKAALQDPRLSQEGRAKVRLALAKQLAVDRYRQNLPKR